MKNIIAFIHAKGNSSRIPGKNLKILGDMPLFCHAIKNALDAKLVDSVVIDSNSDEILTIGSRHGAIPLKRDERMATNMTTGDDLAYWQASNYPNSEIILQVIPTSPFILPSSIDKAIQCLIENNVDSVVGVVKESLYVWVDGKPSYFDLNGKIPNSFDLKPTVYETTGLYVNKTKFVLEHKKRINVENCLPFYLNKCEAIDINTPDDFRFAEIVLNGIHISGNL